MGRDRYPEATTLLVTADAGGSNGYRNKLWKIELAKLAAETGLTVTVCHYPWDGTHSVPQVSVGAKHIHCDVPFPGVGRNRKRTERGNLRWATVVTASA